MPLWWAGRAPRDAVGGRDGTAIAWCHLPGQSLALLATPALRCVPLELCLFCQGCPTSGWPSISFISFLPSSLCCALSPAPSLCMAQSAMQTTPRTKACAAPCPTPPQLCPWGAGVAWAPLRGHQSQLDQLGAGGGG